MRILNQIINLQGCGAWNLKCIEYSICAWYRGFYMPDLLALAAMVTGIEAFIQTE